MNSKVKVLSIVSISALLLIIILWAAGVFKSGPESYLEDTSCVYCPGSNYLEFFESNFDEENLSLKIYDSKSKKKMIRVNAIVQNKDTTSFYFIVISDSVVFLKLKISGQDYLRDSDYASDYFMTRCSGINSENKESEENTYYNGESNKVGNNPTSNSSDEDGLGALIVLFIIAAITFLSGLSFGELLFWILLIIVYVNLIRYLKRGARYFEKRTDRMNEKDEALDTFLKEGSEYFKSKNSEDSDEDL